MKRNDIHNIASQIVHQILSEKPSGDGLINAGNEEGQEKEIADIKKNIVNSDFLFSELKAREQFDYLPPYIKFRKRNRRLKTIKYTFGATAAAAVALLFLILNKDLPFFSNKENKVITVSEIQPGGKKAMLILENGATIDLTEKKGSVVAQNGAVIDIGTAGVKYKESTKTAVGKKMVYNTLYVPKCGEYSLTLADGTKVWLNADSKLRYPVNFTGDRRVVYLTGEAYFEVQKNAGKPFIVSTELGEVLVLGTKFNVKKYPEEQLIYTTLVEGSVAFKNEKSGQTKITPGHQLRFGATYAEPEVLAVNTANYISWKDNMLHFQEQSLGEIMTVLERWYDVNITFQSDEIKSTLFTGNLDKYATINSFFRLFEAGSSIRFEINGREIKVLRK